MYTYTHIGVQDPSTQAIGHSTVWYPNVSAIRVHGMLAPPKMNATAGPNNGTT